MKIKFWLNSPIFGAQFPGVVKNTENSQRVNFVKKTLFSQATNGERGGRDETRP